MRERDPRAELEGLSSKSFVGIAVAQFFTSFNDNAYRWLIIPIGIAISSWESTALSAGLAVFVIPYIVLLRSWALRARSSRLRRAAPFRSPFTKTECRPRMGFVGSPPLLPPPSAP